MEIALGLNVIRSEGELRKCSRESFDYVLAQRTVEVGV